MVYTVLIWKRFEKVKVLVIQSRPTLCYPIDYTPPGSFIHEILQAGILKWVVIPFSRTSSQPRDWTLVSCIACGFFITEPPGKPSSVQWLKMLSTPTVEAGAGGPEVADQAYLGEPLFRGNPSSHGVHMTGGEDIIKQARKTGHLTT